MNTSDQFRLVERLRDKIVRADAERKNHTVNVRLTGNHEQRRFDLRNAQLLDDVSTIDVTGIAEYDNVVIIQFAKVDRLDTFRRAVDVERLQNATSIQPTAASTRPSRHRGFAWALALVFVVSKT